MGNDAVAKERARSKDGPIEDLVWNEDIQRLDVLAHASDRADRDDALDAGASAFLQKPVDSLRLVAAIQDLVGRSALLRPETGKS